MSKIKKYAGIALGIVVLLVAIVVAAFFLMKQSGKKNLNNDILDGLLREDGTHVSGDYETKVYEGQEYQYKDNVINILCMGLDKEEPMTVRNDADKSMGQADALFLLSIDLQRKEIRLVAIPRDTMVTLQCYTDDGTYMGEAEGQITLQYAYGDGRSLSATLTAQQVSDIMGGIPINAYLAINVHSLWELNDVIGGVDVTMDADYTAYNPAFVEGETVHLTGNLLENYLRGRDKRDPDGAYLRMHRMKQYMLAYFETAKEAVKKDMTIPVRLLSYLKDDIETDVTADEAMYLVTEAISCTFLSEDMYTLPGENLLISNYMEFHLDEAGVEEMVVDLFYERK